MTQPNQPAEEPESYLSAAGDDDLRLPDDGDQAAAGQIEDGDLVDNQLAGHFDGDRTEEEDPYIESERDK